MGRAKKHREWQPSVASCPPIDAVITWVDGQDPAHQAKLARHLSLINTPEPESAAPTRFNQCGEIDYCVLSLLRFAPWIRTIFIVTDNQTPAIINRLKDTTHAHKIKLIDHRDIFPKHKNVLPTFNSLSIESVLWRIEGLANHFIYLNDDCALLNPVTPADFFRGDQRVLRGTWKTQSDKKWHHRWRAFWGNPIPVSAHRALQENTAQLAGWENKFFHLPHIPLPLCKLTFEHFFQKHPEYLSQNIQYPLRSPMQFWPISLAQHLDIKNHQVCFDNKLKAISINGATQSLKKIKARLNAAEKSNATFVCTQSLDLASVSTQYIVFEWLDKHIQGCRIKI